jgi:hypothetical protein
MEAGRREELLEKYVRGTSSAEELVEIEKLISEDEAFRKDLETQKVIFESLQILEEKDKLKSAYIFKEEAKVVPLNTRKWITYAAAASFILVAVTFSWLFLRQEDKSTFISAPIYEYDSSMGFVKPKTSPVDSAVVAIYSSKDYSGTYSFSQDTLKLYVSKPDFALDILFLYDDETSRYTLDLGGRRYLIVESEAQKKLQPLVNER